MFHFLRRKKKSSGERNVAFYNDMYQSGGHLGQYHVHYSNSMYLPVWLRGVEILTMMGNPCVLDIGCGPGQFAHLLYDRGITGYTGIDHSSVAIELAKKQFPGWAERFRVADVFSNSVLSEVADVVVMFEVLEHLERDLDLLKLIPSGRNILFSVPSYGSASHVRQFKTTRSVKKRYASHVNIYRLEEFAGCPEPGKSIFLVQGKIP